MANTKLLVEINDILTRIDKKIEDVKSTVLEATSVATPKMK